MYNSFDNKDYYKKMSPKALLDKEREKQLIVNAQNGCKKSQNKLILHNIKNVFNIVRPCRLNFRYDENDLFQEAIIGMIKAIKSYDPDKKVPFWKYATYKIRKQVNQYIHLNSFSVKIPCYLKDIFHKIKQLEKQYDLDNEHVNLSAKQISHHLNISENSAIAYFKYIKNKSYTNQNYLEEIYELQ